MRSHASTFERGIEATPLNGAQRTTRNASRATAAALGARRCGHSWRVRAVTTGGSLRIPDRRGQSSGRIARGRTASSSGRFGHTRDATMLAVIATTTTSNSTVVGTRIQWEASIVTPMNTRITDNP